MLVLESIYEIRDLPFVNDVLAKGGKIYSVGGAIRDSFLSKPSKDLDILVTNIEIPALIEILEKYGKVDLVGQSFGIIKFKPKGETEDIDIAVPRTERKMGDGHKGFEVTADPYLPIETDLSRRDFTINAMAKDLEGNLIDPFNGLGDLKSKTIRIVNPVAFADDPLRMLRAIQFASRFGFSIEPNTFKLIKDNAWHITSISPERVLIELEKIVTKGDKALGAKLLVDSGLYKYIFKRTFNANYTDFNNVQSLAEFIYILCNYADDASTFFKDTLKGDIDTTKDIRALSLVILAHGRRSSQEEYMYDLFKALNTSMSVLDSKIIPTEEQNMLAQFKNGKYPKSFKELAVGGHDIMGLGYKGVQVGQVLNRILLAVLTDKITNNYDVIMTELTKDKMDKLK